MSWPTPQDYNEAMQAPWLNLKDNALQSGKPALDFLGLPRPMTGAFASVYKLEFAGRSYAIKLFLRNIPDQQARYIELSRAINSKELTNTVGFQYQPEGISVKGKNFPLLRMDWAEGDNLDLYIEDHLAEPGSLAVLLYHFRQMINNLRNSGVAHGDLQHGNILVNNGDLKLVDYDGMYVAKLKGMRSNELGHPNFQHPGRTGMHFGPYLDHFSSWAIQTSLLSVSVDPSLWGKLSGGDDCLLFRRSDFEKPDQSDAFKLLESHDSEAINSQARLLRRLLDYPPEHVPALDEHITDVSHLPSFKPVEVATKSKAVEIGLSSKAEGSGSSSKEFGSVGANSGVFSTQYTQVPVTFVKGIDPVKLVANEAGEPAVAPQVFSGAAFPDWMQGAYPIPQNPFQSAPVFTGFSDASLQSAPLNNTHSSIHGHSQGNQNNADGVFQPLIREVNTTLPWPRFDQYRQSFNEPDLCFADPELKDGRLIPEMKGLGSNGFVFHVRCPNRHVALKCFKEHVPDRQERFEAIRKYVNSDARRYFIDFSYEPRGIRVGKYWYPTLKMEWLPQTLGEYINANIRNKARLASLSDRFHVMVQALHTLGIAHGDLEPDNIMVVSGDFKLIDYDGMYIPELDGFNGIELGHPAFQHPGRGLHHFGPKLDYFSAWILDAELSYLRVNPELWVQAEIRSQAAVAKTSRGIQDSSFLETHPSKSVRHTGDVWLKLLDYDIDSIPRFDPRSPIFTMRTT
jgi:tRNA A-37 threonylcarbamoyl transferase component Bud32